MIKKTAQHPLLMFAGALLLVGNAAPVLFSLVTGSNSLRPNGAEVAVAALSVVLYGSLLAALVFAVTWVGRRSRARAARATHH